MTLQNAHGEAGKFMPDESRLSHLLIYEIIECPCISPARHTFKPGLATCPCPQQPHENPRGANCGGEWRLEGHRLRPHCSLFPAHLVPAEEVPLALVPTGRWEDEGVLGFQSGRLMNFPLCSGD